MRLAIRESMSAVRIVDLHGSAAKKEICPDGSPDANVFDIQQGVGISLWVKGTSLDDLADLMHADLWGSRNSKYANLLSKTVSSVGLNELNPNDPYHFFVPKDFDQASEYVEWTDLVHIFNVHGSGVKTDRDKLFIDESEPALANRMGTLFSSRSLKEEFRAKYRVENSSSYPLLKRLQEEDFDSGAIRPCLYRPFDLRWIYYSPGLTSRPAWYVMQYMQGTGNICFLAMRQYEYNVPQPCYFLVTTAMPECRVFVSNRGIAERFPLYLNDSSQADVLFSGNGSTLNFREKFFCRLAEITGGSSTRNGEATKKLGDDLFHYIYAVVHSPGYRSRYAEYLKIEYPRIPLPGGPSVFHELAQLGSELVALHRR